MEEVPVIYQEPNENELGMLKGTYKPSELIQLEEKEKEQSLTLEEQMEKHKREFITKVKVIALNMCNKNIMSNPSYMSSGEKNKVRMCMEQLVLLSDVEITERFNDICSEKIFQPNTDFEKLYNK